jgi:hypothetical protein
MILCSKQLSLYVCMLVCFIGCVASSSDVTRSKTIRQLISEINRLRAVSIICFALCTLRAVSIICFALFTLRAVSIICFALFTLRAVSIICFALFTLRAVSIIWFALFTHAPCPCNRIGDESDAYNIHVQYTCACTSTLRTRRI